jgi:hypothetical protein
MKINKIEKEEKAPVRKVGRVVEPSTPVSINITGGNIKGIFRGTQVREYDGGEYTLQIIEAESGIGYDKKTDKPFPLEPKKRYGVFSSQRLSRLMREVAKGDEVEIAYKGMAPNPKTEANPKAEGQHHEYEVLIMD